MKRLFIPLVWCFLLIASCTALRHVPKEESLYTGAKIKVITPGKVQDQNDATKAVNELIRPKSNTSILGSRPLLWLWYVAGKKKKEKGFGHWLKKKMGEPPVYFSMTDPTLVSKAIDAKLYNMGFFNSFSQYQINESKSGRKTTITYQLFMTEAYTYNEIIYTNDKSDSLSEYLITDQKRTLLKTGKRYDLDVLIKERSRMDETLKHNGFYYFNPDYILFKMDTALGLGRLNLYVTIKPETPEKSKLIYKIADVNVYPDYKLGQDSLNGTKQVIDTTNYYDVTGYVRPEPVIRTIFLKNNVVYDRRKHNITLNRLNGLGIFKFVNLRITDKDTSPGNWLSVNIFLIPLPKKSISVEMQAASKSNNFIGPALNLSFRNRNTFKGAELMIYNLRGSFETQLNGVYKGRFTYEINPRIELYVPRFMLPFKLKFKINSNFVPRTKYILDYSYMSRVGYFNLNSVKLTFGYKWKQALTIDHDLSLISINYFRLSKPSENFLKLINGNVVLKRRFEEQFIAGIAYSFFYNEQIKRLKRNQVYFNGNIETSGNTISLFHKIVPAQTLPNSDAARVFGIRYAQFIRVDIDVRDYFKLTEKTMFASRFIAGWGLPYGNSSTMPYIKQFFSGGAYSVRGFQAFSIGPGAYSPPDSLKRIFFLQQGGEIKLEANIEYRYPIFGVLKGALFMDAGNVWLNKTTSEIPNSAFSFNTFLPQIAVGMGSGIRVDLSFFVLRLDLGIPVRKPWLPEKHRWVFREVGFSDIVFNLAFGYPF
ncbi:MAG: BamA/TamA family outer membrane protein [Bacteroidia bacterium]|nr:BamA/TamA family outer membrane protein [Bacteroidia bacterium]